MLRNEQVRRGWVFVDMVVKSLLTVQLFWCLCGCSRELQPFWGVKVNCEWSEKQLLTGLLTFGAVAEPQIFSNGYISAAQFNCCRLSDLIVEEMIDVWTREDSYKMVIREMFFFPAENFVEVLGYQGVGRSGGTGGLIAGADIVGEGLITLVNGFFESSDMNGGLDEFYLGVGVAIEALQRQQELRLWRVGIGTLTSKISRYKDAEWADAVSVHGLDSFVGQAYANMAAL